MKNKKNFHICPDYEIRKKNCLIFFLLVHFRQSEKNHHARKKKKEKLAYFAP